jgi:hypothetical protein
MLSGVATPFWQLSDLEPEPEQELEDAPSERVVEHH